jgi:uncharacterized protein (TIGR02246 family)
MTFGVLVLMTGLVAGCAPPQETAPAVDLAAEAQAVKDRSAEWLALYQAKDPAAVVENIMVDDAKSIFDGKVVEGKDAMLANAEAGLAKNPDFVIDWTTSRVEVAASGDMAYELGSWTYDPDGDGEKTGEKGEFVVVWKKVDGEWRCVVDAGSTIKEKEEVAAEE